MRLKTKEILNCWESEKGYNAKTGFQPCKEKSAVWGWIFLFFMHYYLVITAHHLIISI